MNKYIDNRIEVYKDGYSFSVWSDGIGKTNFTDDWIFFYTVQSDNCIVITIDHRYEIEEIIKEFKSKLIGETDITYENQ
jgi:hypothetical protein